MTIVNVTLPGWAHDLADLHVHAAPSLLPRHGDDRQTVAAERDVGFSTVVLKAHEGSTVERAACAGDGEQPNRVALGARLRYRNRCKSSSGREA